MRIFISAGEASGDLHAAALTREILPLHLMPKCFGMGGDALRSAGGEVIFDYKDNSVMGFAEVLRKTTRPVSAPGCFSPGYGGTETGYFCDCRLSRF